jgi:uncharacterized protein YjbI with pentapeptide repeats
MIDPATLALIGKLIGLGLAVKKGMESDKLDENDVGALKNFLETGTELAKLWSRGKDSRAAALHLALVTRAFGKALAQYWVSPEMITPDVIERCLKRASLKVADPNRHLPDEKALALLQALSGDPSGNPYYKALWHAFFDEPVTIPGSTGPLSLLGENPRLFDSYFRRAYVESLATAEGQQVQRWCLGLAAEKREVMRHILAEDMAAWGQRHVFGNVRHQAPGDPMPFLSLDDSYVEPRGRYQDREESILGLVRSLQERHKLVVVKADFGHGKSLTARRLARDLAREWLESRQPAGESLYPVFIKCARDLRDARYDHAEVVRSALWHAAEDAVADRPAKHDDAFAPLESERAALFILDGLDEVALTRNHLEDLFKDLLAALGPGQRALVLTRPGALRDERCLPRATPVIELQPFHDRQIAEWVACWNELSGKVPVDVTRLAALGLATLARTPILLLMIAVTWGDQLADTSQVSKASLYESFFKHIAGGKYGLPGGEEHDAVLEASRRLARELQRRNILREADPVEAMLWLMSRVAWEAHRFAYDWPARELQARHVAALLDDDLGIDDPAMFERIEVGLLLVMQIDPTGASKSILFGHQSFREFLVARYWKHQLLQLIARETKRDQRAKIEERLMQAHLLQDEDEAFALLIEILRGLDVDTRRDIKEWARRYLEIDELTLHRDLQTDRRPVLRESALAIGSCIEREEGLQLDEWALRFLCFSYQFHGGTAAVRAPGLYSPGCDLSGVDLTGADLRGANLAGVDFRRALLSRADLAGANLEEAKLENADLEGANLRGANLEAASLVGANLAGADLEGADLEGALLQGARLKRATLARTKLVGAYLDGAPRWQVAINPGLIEGADLEGANLEAAELTDALLRGVRVSRRQLSTARSEGAVGLDDIDEILESE